MKKLFAISAAAALAAFTMTGCNPTGSSSYTDIYTTEIESVTNGVTTTTEYKYDENGASTSETQYVGGFKTYEIGDYKFEGSKWSCIRTNYAEGGATTTNTLVTTNDGGMETYKVTDASGAVIELRETKYGEKGVSEFKHTVNGTVVLHRTDFDYAHFTDSEYAASNAYYTYKESKDGGEPVTMYYDLNKVISIGQRRQDYVEYEIHVGSRTGTLVKEQTDYESNQLTDSYKIVEYDAEGHNPVTTMVDRTYKSITVTY